MKELVAPRFAIWLHARSLSPQDRDAIIGDLLEGFDARARRDPRAARRWVWSQTFRSLAPNLYRRCFVHRQAPAEAASARGGIVSGLVTDIRYAVRSLKRQPLTSIVALASLTAALALNVLLVTIADAVLVRQLPLQSPQDLALVLLQGESGLNHNFSYPDYRDLRDRAQGVEALVAYSPASATIDTTNGAMPADGEVVSGNFFAALGVRIRNGRALSEADDRAGAPRTVVISERLWRDRFAAANVSDRVLLLNGQPYTIVGVADRMFDGMRIGQRASFWVPLAHSASVAGGDYLQRRTTSWLTIVGRLRNGVAASAVRDELDAIFRAIRTETKGAIAPVVLEPGGRGDSILSSELASPFRLLLIAGAIVLLVACMNVANLQLARTDHRRFEMAVRAALGARRSQLVRLVAIDGFLLAFIAGSGAIAIAAWLKEAAVSLIAFYGQPVALDVHLDARAVAVTAVLSIVAGLAIAILAIVPILRRGPSSLASSRTVSPLRPALQRTLVVAQVALSMALVAGAALLMRTVDRMRHADLGFDPRGVAVLQVSPEMGRLTRAQGLVYFDEAIRAVSALPGVESAAVSHVMPLDFGGSRMTVDVSGYKPVADEDMELNFTRVTPKYFATMGIPLLQGRAFDERDREGQPDRIIVNETMARRYWPEGRAVGGRLRTSPSDPYGVEVIGVVPDVHYRMVREEPVPSFYVALAQYRADAGVLHVRLQNAADGSPANVSRRIDELRRVVSAVNPGVPVTRAHTLTDQIERNIANERMARAIGATLAVVALVLAAAGLYATMAFVVGRRTKEIGVRMALGARVADVRALVLREGVALAAIGVAAGLALSVWVGHALESVLFGVSRTDPISLAAAAATLATAAILASWIPARRASRVDPVVALRDE